MDGEAAAQGVGSTAAASQPRIVSWCANQAVHPEAAQRSTISGRDRSAASATSRTVTGIPGKSGTSRDSHGGFSHLLAEVEQVRDRVALIAEGRLVEEGPPATLGATRGRIRGHVTAADTGAAGRVLPASRPGTWAAASSWFGHHSGQDVNAGTALAIVGFCLLLTWAAVHNARAALASPKIPGFCARAATPNAHR